MGDENHYSAVVKSKMFAGLSKIDQHKLVYKSLKVKWKRVTCVNYYYNGKIMEIKQTIQNYIDNNDVCLFMKGTPETPSVVFQWLYQMYSNT